MHANIADRAVELRLDDWLREQRWDELTEHKWLKYPKNRRSIDQLIEDVSWD